MTWSVQSWGHRSLW